MRILNAGTGNTLLNNFLLGGSDIAYRISNDSLPGLVSDYNIASSLFQSEDTSATETLAQWRTQTGQDMHSFGSTAAALGRRRESVDRDVGPGLAGELGPGPVGVPRLQLEPG